MSGAFAVMIVKARRRIVDGLRAAGATTRETAATFNPGSRLVERRLFERMLKFGAVREAAPGRYWLDEDRLSSFRRHSRLRMLGGVAIGSLLAAGAIVLGA